VAKGELIAAKSIGGSAVNGLKVEGTHPSALAVADAVPGEAARYLKQALETKHAPDACVLMCAASIDAMLKEKGFKDGSLSKRLDEALAAQLIPKALRIGGIVCGLTPMALGMRMKQCLPLRTMRPSVLSTSPWR
jgi:hypothetical protein